MTLFKSMAKEKTNIDKTLAEFDKQHPITIFTTEKQEHNFNFLDSQHTAVKRSIIHYKGSPLKKKLQYPTCPPT
jgi:hypothetical protein